MQKWEMSVICIKFNSGIALVTINKCTVRVCVTLTLSQNRDRKHSGDSRTPKRSLITKSTNNSRTLDSNLFNNWSLLFSYPSSGIFKFYRDKNYVFTKWALFAFVWIILGPLNFIRLRFRTHLVAGELQSRKHTIFRTGWKFEIKNEPYLRLKFS